MATSPAHLRKRRIRLVHVGKFYPPDFGGIETVTRTLAEGSAVSGYDVTVTCMGSADTTEVVGGVCVRRSKTSLEIFSQPISIRYLIRTIELLRFADIVHFHAPNMLGALAILLSRIPATVVVHWHSDVLKKGLLGLIFRPLELAVLKRATRVVVTSRAYAESSSMLQRFIQKVAIVPIGIKDSAMRGYSGPQIPEAVMTLRRSRSIVLSVGRLVRYKGFGVLVESAKFMHDSLIVIVGRGPLERELKEAVRKKGLQDRVVFTGELSESALNALFAEASVFCLPSITRAEAFGVVLLEAMAHGVPIVATRIHGSGVTSVNVDGVSGINVQTHDPIAIADACNAIIENPEFYRRLSKGARERFLSNFSEDLFIARMLRVYDEILDARGPT